MTKDEAGKLVLLLGANWPAKELPPETVQLFTSKLKPYDLRAGRQAVEWLIDNATHFPVWAEVRAALTKYAGPPALAAPSTAPPPGRMIYRVWDDALDDYVELPEPRPWDDERDDPFRRMARTAAGPREVPA